MRHPKIIMAGVALAAVAAAGGITAAAAGGSSGTTAGPASTGSAATVRTVSASVGGKTEPILVTAAGQPLYIYRPDSAGSSLVTGGLAQLWPPLTAAAPAAGVSGKIAVLNDGHGHQVTYNGHPLYTFVDDHGSQVTGQGVQNFVVATPGIARIGSSSAATGTAPAAPAGGYGY